MEGFLPTAENHKETTGRLWPPNIPTNRIWSVEGTWDKINVMLLSSSPGLGRRCDTRRDTGMLVAQTSGQSPHPGARGQHFQLRLLVLDQIKKEARGRCKRQLCQLRCCQKLRIHHIPSSRCP